MKKIGLVLPSVPGYSETFFRSKIKGLQQNGFQVVIFSGNSTKAKDIPCTVIYAPKLRGNKAIVGLNSVIQLLKAFLLNYTVTQKFLQAEKKDGTSLKNRIKKLIANHFILTQKLDWLHYGFGTMALGRENVAQAINAKMAVSFRGFDIGIYPLKHSNCYKKLFSKVDKIHVISDDLRGLLYKNGLSKDIEIVKITPAIDTNFFKPSPKSQNSILQISTIARLHWKKGLEHTIEALSLLKRDGIDFKYTLIGDGDEKERLLFAAYQLGIKENVKFAGKLPHQKVKKELEQTDIYLQYSVQEGFCNAVLEAQAMGVLCVVSDAEGLSENVLHNQTGWVVPKRKPELLAKKINEIINLSATEKERIRANAIERVQHEFNIEKQQQEFLEFYNI